MAKKILGIEIGSSTIKLIEVKKKGTVLVVEKFSLMKTPKDCVQDGVMTNIEPIYNIISKEIKEKRYQAKKAVVLLQSTTIIIRNLVVDTRPEKVIKQILAIKPEEYLPVEQGQYQIDFKILDSGVYEQDGRMEMLLVAAPNNIVLHTLNLVESLKLKPIRMTIPSEALVNVFGEGTQIEGVSEENVLVLDIGWKSTTATIISRGQAVLTRIIDFGTYAVDDMMNHSLRDSFMQKGEGASPEELRAEYDAYLQELIRPQIEYSIIAEVERILQFYYSRFDNRPIQKIYFMGGGAEIQGLQFYIKELLNIETESIHYLSTVIGRKAIGFKPYMRFFINILGAVKGV